VVSNQDLNDAALADLVYGETDEDAGVGSQPSMSTSSSKPPGGTSMPPVGTTFLWLLGLSSAPAPPR
jgi:hypothetical protein